ncbi:MAG: HPr family phosphocarrier protein [Desulfobacterales bacterium]
MRDEAEKRISVRSGGAGNGITGTPEAIETLFRETTVVNELGIHARSAAKIAEVAQNAKRKVWICRDREQVDASSIIDILTLGCAKGTTITIRVECPEDIEILSRIVGLVENGFGE